MLLEIILMKDMYSSKEDLIPVVEMCRETVGVHVEKETRRGRRDV